MRIVNEFAPGAIAGGATIRTERAAIESPALRRSGLVRRIKALATLFVRGRRKSAGIRELDQLDSATRRDLGLAEGGWSARGAAARAEAVRRDVELNYLLSASSRFVVRNVDAGL